MNYYADLFIIPAQTELSFELPEVDYKEAEWTVDISRFGFAGSADLGAIRPTPVLKALKAVGEHSYTFSWQICLVTGYVGAPGRGGVRPSDILPEISPLLQPYPLKVRSAS